VFTYLHANSMGVDLPSQEAWHAIFERAGFGTVDCTQLRMPGSRMFVVSA
jgi:hypothetical protein